MEPLAALGDLAPPTPLSRLRLVASLLLSCLGVVAVGGAALYYRHLLRDPHTLRGLRAGGEPIGPLESAALDQRLAEIADRYLDGWIDLRLGDERLRARRRDAGLRVDVDAWAREARAVGRSGEPIADARTQAAALRGEVDVPLRPRLDRQVALDFLSDLKERFDRAPVDARLDLDQHTVAAERGGRVVAVYESFARLDEAVNASSSGAAPTVELAVQATRAQVAKQDFKAPEISTVLGTWETHYSTLAIDSDRTYNLKVGADHLNGHILQPHALFSFNEVVGPRTEKEGYRVAPVIQGGELIDGLAGGMCQIASTLHAAAMFGGLDIVSATTHSRPSAYIPLGLDATVIYPGTDLKLRNPYDFPIVVHMQVHHGGVKVELLGRERPYKVLFEREILEENDFRIEERSDPTAPKGQRLVLQSGYPGYRGVRRRFKFAASETLPRWLGDHNKLVDAALARAKITPVTVEKWSFGYPSTSEIAAIGSGPKTLRKKPPPPSHRIPPVPKWERPIARLLR